MGRIWVTAVLAVIAVITALVVLLAVFHCFQGKSVVNGQDNGDSIWGPSTVQYLEYKNSLPNVKKRYGSNRTGLFKLDGYVVDEALLRGYYEVRNEEGKPGDVVLVSFPTTETKCLETLIYNVLTNFNLTNNVTKFRYLEWPDQVPELESTPSEPVKLIKTHLPYVLLPKGLRRSKIIYVVRNPKDVVVALYQLHRSIKGTHNPNSVKGIMEEFIHSER